jgi:heme iron utilization protein
MASETQRDALSMLSPGSFDPVRAARRLISEARSGALATILPSGAPYASLVTVAPLHDGAPVLLLSRLARHTNNIQEDPRVSLMVEERRAGDPLEGARVSISGTIAVTEVPAAERRFLARHPSAAAYAGFKDFDYWRIEIFGAHLVAGFGRIVELRASDLTFDPLDAEVEADAIEHMNKDHFSAVDLYATKLLGAPHGPWRIIGIDPDGCDLILGDMVRRLDFPQRVTTPGALRKMLADLAQEARRR